MVLDRKSLLKRPFNLRSTVMGVVERVDTLIARLAFGFGVQRHRCANRAGTGVLILTPGGSNIGDQAMYESCVANIPGPLTVVVPDGAHYDHERALAQSKDCTLLVSKILFTGLSLARCREILSLASLFSQARFVCFLGADIVDGGYSIRTSFRIWDLAREISRCGTQTRILGCSWKGTVDSRVLKIARRAISSGVEAFLRDPYSAQRFRAAIGNCDVAADVVFASPPSQDDNDLAALIPSGHRYAVLNASALIDQTMDLSEDYAQVCRWLTRHHCTIILLPHVAHPSANDVVLAEVLASRLPGNTVVVDRLLTPSSVRAIVRNAQIVITGRMHLGILSILEGTPNIILSTQGKVDGLMALVESPTNSVVPSVGVASAIIDIGQHILDDPFPSRERLHRCLPQVMELAHLNFVGLG